MKYQESAKLDTASVPGHVPQERIFPYDLLSISGEFDDPFEVMDSVREVGDIVYTPFHYSSANGAWVLTRAEDIRYVLQNPQLFSSKGISGVAKMLGENWDLIPLELDPPRQTQFRALLNPLLSPPKVAAMEDGIRAACNKLIDGIIDRGNCDFVESFARPFPIKIFLQLMGLPLEMFEQFMAWNNTLLFDFTHPDERVAAAAAIRDYLKELIAKRKANPVDDFASIIAHANVDGKPISDQEILGIYYLLFVGGLDTLAASLGFYFRYLAAHPEKQQLLRENPSLIPNAVEELLRAHSVVMVSRFVTEDTEVGGVSMKKGDCIAIYTAFASLDPTETENPEVIDFDRGVKPHVAFSYGPHRCLGSHLARRELVIAIEEWTRRIPDFRLPQDGKVTMHGGAVFSVNHLPLEWPR